MTMQFKSGVWLKQLDEEGHGLAQIATLAEIDHDGDTYQAGAFGDQFAAVLPTHQWQHVPLGKARVFDDGVHGLAEFEFNLEIEAARDWHSALKFDLNDGRDPLQEWSFGFDIIDSSMETRDGETVRVLKQLEVHEISPVLLGAGIGTGTLSIKSAADEVAQLAEIMAAAPSELTPAQLDYLGKLKSLLAQPVEADLSDAEEDEEKAAATLAASLVILQSKNLQLAASGCCRVDGAAIKGRALGTLLRDLREENDLGNSDLATAAGIDVSTMGAILAGDINCPPMRRLEGLAELFDVPVARLRAAAEEDGCEF